MKHLSTLVLAAILVLGFSIQPAAGQSRPAPPGSTTPVRLTTARIAPLPQSAWTDAHRTLVARYAPDGRVGNALATLLHVPELVEAIMPFVTFLVNESSLAPRERALLVLRTAWLTQNQYLWAEHAARALGAGLTRTDLRRIAQGPGAGGWDPFELSLLSLADELFRNSSVTDATWTTLGVQYNLMQMTEAVMNVNEHVLLAMMLNAMGVQPNDWDTERLPADVPYRVAAPDAEPPLLRPRIAPIEGDGLRVGRTFARHPRLAEARGGQSNYVNRISPLMPYHRELLILRIGWVCQAVYEWAKHVGSVGRARDHGLEPLWIALGPGDPRWDPFEVSLLHFADELYRDTAVTDETWAAVTARFDTRETMSALMTVSNYRLVSMSLNAFGVQPLETDELFPVLP